MSTTEAPDGGLSGWASGGCGPGTHLQDLLKKRDNGELVSLDLLFLQGQVFAVAEALGVRMSDGTSTVALINGAGVEGPEERNAAIRNAQKLINVLESYISMQRIRRGDRKPFDPEPEVPSQDTPAMNTNMI